MRLRDVAMIAVVLTATACNQSEEGRQPSSVKRPNPAPSNAALTVRTKAADEATDAALAAIPMEDRHSFRVIERCRYLDAVRQHRVAPPLTPEIIQQNLQKARDFPTVEACLRRRPPPKRAAASVNAGASARRASTTDLATMEEERRKANCQIIQNTPRTPRKGMTPAQIKVLEQMERNTAAIRGCAR